MKTYYTETHECYIREQKISIVNVTPKYRQEERNTDKKRIEQQLYDVFCKYVTDEA